MLKKVTIMIMIFSTLVLGKINDYRETFSEENKEKINSAIELFQKETGKNLYLNTLQDNEGFEPENQEETVILNLIKNKEHEDGILKVQIKISQDLNPEELSSDLSLLLDNSQEHLTDKNEEMLALSLIDGLKEILIIESNYEEESNFLVQYSLLTKIFSGILLTILLLYIRIIQVKRKKKKYKFSSR